MHIHGDLSTTQEYGTAQPGETDVEGVVILGYDPAVDKWLALEWAEQQDIWLVGGGKEAGESFQQTAVRELREETGYTTYQDQIQLGGPVVSHYYNEKKALYRRSYSYSFCFCWIQQMWVCKNWSCTNNSRWCGCPMMTCASH